MSVLMKLRVRAACVLMWGLWGGGLRVLRMEYGVLVMLVCGVECAVSFVVRDVESVDARCSCVRGVVFVSCDVCVRVLFDLPKAVLSFEPFPKLFGTLFELVVARKVCGVGRAFDEVKITP